MCIHAGIPLAPAHLFLSPRLRHFSLCVFVSASHALFARTIARSRPTTRPFHATPPCDLSIFARPTRPRCVWLQDVLHVTFVYRAYPYCLAVSLTFTFLRLLPEQKDALDGSSEHIDARYFPGLALFRGAPDPTITVGIKLPGGRLGQFIEDIRSHVESNGGWNDPDDDSIQYNPMIPHIPEPPDTTIRKPLIAYIVSLEPLLNPVHEEKEKEDDLPDEYFPRESMFYERWTPVMADHSQMALDDDDDERSLS